MAKRSKISKKLKELGDIQVNDWELPEVLTKDISELEIGHALHQLGNLQVTDWDLKDILPALQRLGQTEIDIVGLLKNAAEYKVTEWDIRQALLRSKADRKKLSKKEIAAVSNKLKNLLQYLVEQLVDEPNYASIHIEEIAPQVLKFQIVLKKRDVAMLIGMNGYTASPIRHIIKDVALYHGVYALLQIQSHEDAAHNNEA